MATYDSADILSRCATLANEPSFGDVTASTVWYQLLSDAQVRLVAIIAQQIPHVMVNAPAAMSTADGGLTYTFPNSDTPYGYCEIRDGRSGSVLVSGAEFSNADYVFEGDKIRIPDGRTRTFNNGLYCRYITMPTVINASTEPTVKPAQVRVCLVYDAVAIWCALGNQRDPSFARGLWQRTLFGDPNTPGDLGIIGAAKAQVWDAGVDASNNYATAGMWWRRPF